MREHLRLLNWLEDSDEIVDPVVYVRSIRVGYVGRTNLLSKNN